LPLTSPLLDVIVTKTPWFFEMRSLIAERLNLVPVGLGNNETPIDLSILLPNKSSENVEAFSDAADEGGEGDEDRVGTAGKEREVQDVDAEAEWDASMAAGAASNTEGSEGVTNDEPDSDKEGEVLEVPAKHKSKNEVKEEVKPEGKKTAAHPGTSTPAAKRDKKKAKTTAEKFSDIARMEEESVQKELELKAIRAKGGSSVKIAKIEAQAKLQMEKEKTKAALAAKKMEHTFQLQMLELQQ
jgi:hypothetical protein